ncbi:MAG TPA: molybdenum cofactor guanylyltransferase MobA [Aestuariivirgaceae bacterium]|nr:molybdenum cofactor guanylyltransferase MobA [Aestuariivirgaceae bacterium]
MNEPIAGVILAGGLARRMGGGDKGLIRLGGKPIVDHVIDRLKPQTDALIINANGEPSRFAAYGLPVVPDSIEGSAGPLAGVLAGLDWAAERGFDHVVSAATDTPFFPRDLVTRFRAAVMREGADLVVAASQGRHHPVFGLWPCTLRQDLRKALRDEGTRKVDEWTAQHRLAVAHFDARDYDPFFNANRPEDLAEAEDILSRYSP